MSFATPNGIFIGPSSAGYPAGFWYSTGIVFAAPFQAGTFVESNVLLATSLATTDGGLGWNQDFSSSGPIPQQGTFTLTISSVGPQSTVDGGPNSPTQWTSPPGHLAATLELTDAPDAGPFLGPLTVNVTF
jgi:hypothetical protein